MIPESLIISLCLDFFYIYSSNQLCIFLSKSIKKESKFYQIKFDVIKKALRLYVRKRFTWKLARQILNNPNLDEDLFDLQTPNNNFSDVVNIALCMSVGKSYNDWNFNFCDYIPRRKRIYCTNCSFGRSGYFDAVYQTRLGPTLKIIKRPNVAAIVY